jgi:hypothetical protein
MPTQEETQKLAEMEETLLFLDMVWSLWNPTSDLRPLSWK